MPAFKRFLTYGGDLYYVEGTFSETMIDGVPISLSPFDALSSYRVGFIPQQIASMSSQWTVGHPPMLELVNVYLDDGARKKLLLDIINDVTREKILNAGTNA